MDRISTGSLANSARMFLINSIPLAPGRLRSTITKSGFISRILAMPSAASPASPQILKPSCELLISCSSPFRNNGWSSTTMIRFAFSGFPAGLVDSFTVVPVFIQILRCSILDLHSRCHDEPWSGQTRAFRLFASFFERQIHRYSSSAAARRFDFEASSDRFGAVIHDVKAEPSAIVLLRIHALAVVGNAKNNLALSSARLQKDIACPRVFVRIDHCLTQDRKSTRLNSSHANISYAVFCLKKKNKHDDLGAATYPQADGAAHDLAVTQQIQEIRAGGGSHGALGN